MTRSLHDALPERPPLKRGRQPLQEQIVEFLRGLICDGGLPEGSRLPPSRRLAAQLGVSRTTVVEAYDRLVVEGYAQSRPRAGVFVANVLPEPLDTAAGERATGSSSAHDSARNERRAPVTSAAVSTPNEYELPLAPGVPAIDRFPWNIWSKLSARVLRSEAARAVGWGDPRGERPLREAIAEYLRATRGIACTPGQVIVASGSQPLVEAIVRASVSRGAEVWFEEPGDPASRAVLAALGLDTVPIPVDRHGLDVNAGRSLAPHARLALVAPSHHYPLGVTMSLERRRALLEWAAASDALVIENEIDADYRFVRRAHSTLHSLDAAERVIYLGSFNKAIAPGLRIGYAVVPSRILDALPVFGPTVSVASQLMLAQFWASGHLAYHMRLLQRVHARRRTLLLSALRAEAAELLQARPPETGLRVPLVLPENCADEEIARELLAAGIKVGRPFSSCYADACDRPGITIGFASTPEKRIRPAVGTLSAVIRSAAARRVASPALGRH